MTIAYVSLPPGSIPTGLEATISNAGGNTTRVTMIDGGFDPVPIESRTGEILTVVINPTRMDSSILHLTVPPPRKPTIIRTVPVSFKRDVPINGRIIMVFSEPMDGASIGASSIQLREKNSGELIDGQLVFADASHTTVEFVPNRLLKQSTDYVLAINASLRDVEGSSLESGATVPFQTGSGQPSVAAPLVVSRVNPSPFAVGVSATNPLIEVWFTEPVDYASVGVGDQTSLSRVHVLLGNAPVPGNTTCELVPGSQRACSSLRFVPLAPLVQGVAYRIEVAPGLLGISGSRLTARFESGFSTQVAPTGGLQGVLSVASFRMVEFQDTDLTWYYAPLLRLSETGGNDGISILKMKFSIPGLAPEFPSVCEVVPIPPGQSREMFQSPAGSDVSFFNGGVSRTQTSDASVIIYYIDTWGHAGSLRASTTITPGPLPAPPIGSPTGIRWFTGAGCP